MIILSVKYTKAIVNKIFPHYYISIIININVIWIENSVTEEEILYCHF